MLYETIGGLALIFGIYTRWVAAFLGIHLLFAAYLGHAANGWNFSSKGGGFRISRVLGHRVLRGRAPGAIGRTIEGERLGGRSPMSRIEQRLAALGLVLPEPIKPPPGVVLPFQFVRIAGNRGYISGHRHQNPDGSIAEPLGKLGRDLTIEQGYAAARLTALSILGSLKRSLGDLDQVTQWIRVFGMVNSGPGFNKQPSVINGFSDLILELWGAQAGAHSRSAVGMAELPFDIPVEIEAMVEIAI